MGKKSFSLPAMARLLALAGIILSGAFSTAFAVDLPLASESPLAGIGFDDKPLFLPLQRNFQMAMLTAGSELGRSCGKMEAYGWRMSQSEQGRVDKIFNSTVERLRGMGYVVAMQNPSSISHDITIFTADSPKKHLLSMWSAGEIGLVMVLCETAAPPPTHTATGVPVWPSVQTFPQDVVQSKLETPVTRTARAPGEKFTPVGMWVGSYICAQGYTGATLTIHQLRGNNFDGDFHFYPTAKNPSVPEGRYSVFGQYDADSMRILINPGKWIKRPRDYYNTIIVGGFDSSEDSLSAYFQGINGCTSFEAHRVESSKSAAASPARKHPKKHKAKKVAAKAPASPKAAASTLDVSKVPAISASTLSPPPAMPLADAPAPDKDKPSLIVGEPMPAQAAPATTSTAPASSGIALPPVDVPSTTAAPSK